MGDTPGWHTRHFHTVFDDPELFGRGKISFVPKLRSRGYKPRLISVRFMPGARWQPLHMSAYGPHPLRCGSDHSDCLEQQHPAPAP